LTRAVSAFLRSPGCKYKEIRRNLQRDVGKMTLLVLGGVGSLGWVGFVDKGTLLVLGGVR